MDILILFLVAAIGGYLFGSIPSGLLLTRIAGMGDIRQIGSGNIGATNVLRTGNKFIAALTLVADVAKGLAGASLVPVLIGLLFPSALPPSTPVGDGAAHLPDIAPIAGGLGAFIGHCYPVWLKFAGGKGVATFIGVLAGWLPWIAVVFCLTWLVTALVGRISSLSAFVAAIVTCLAFLYLQGATLMFFALVAMVVLLYWRHRKNILRLIAGQEPRIGH